MPTHSDNQTISKTISSPKSEWPEYDKMWVRSST